MQMNEPEDPPRIFIRLKGLTHLINSMYQNKKPVSLKQKMEAMLITFGMLGTFPECDGSVFLKKAPLLCDLKKPDSILYNYWNWLNSKLVYDEQEFKLNNPNKPNKPNNQMLLYCDYCVLKDIILVISWLSDNFNFVPFVKLVEFFGDYAKFLKLYE